MSQYIDIAKEGMWGGGCHVVFIDKYCLTHFIINILPILFVLLSLQLLHDISHTVGQVHSATDEIDRVSLCNTIDIKEKK